jgi:thioredoxin 1
MVFRLVYYTAEWCVACKGMEQTLGKIKETPELGNLMLITVDVGEEPELANRARVQSLPTFVLYKGKDIEDRIVGAMPYDKMVAWLKGHFSKEGVC